MNWIGVIPLIIWLITGPLVLASREITKIDYGIVWFCLMINLLDNCFVG